MVSMKDLAAACNVSIATVSKALNDQRDVSEKTKEMVDYLASVNQILMNNNNDLLYNGGTVDIDGNIKLNNTAAEIIN